MKEKYEHEGVVESVVGEHVVVRILQQAACNGCKARSMCVSSESKEKLIDVYETDAEKKRRVGDVVNVCGALSMGKKAVWLAFGVPLAIIVVWMFVALVALELNELVSVLALVALLAVYFIILHSKRDSLSKQFAFWIE